MQVLYVWHTGEIRNPPKKNKQNTTKRKNYEKQQQQKQNLTERLQNRSFDFPHKNKNFLAK